MTYGLGRVPSPFDDRDYNLRDFMYKKVSLKVPKTVNWLFPNISLDQGDTGHCFPKKTLIRMADGSSKNIEEIEKGDIVVSAEGFSRPVTEIMEREYDGNLVNIKLWGHGHLYCTPEHPILTKRGYIKAIELEESDFISIPRIKLWEKENFLYLNDIVEMDSIKNPHKKTVFPKEKIEKNYDVGKLFGIYLAEGYSDIKSGKVCMAFNKNEKDTLVQETLDLLKEIFDIDAKITTREISNTIIVSFGGVYWAKLFIKLFGSGAENKKITGFLKGNSEFRCGILDGWMAGDGYFRRSGFTGVTVSKQLAHDIFCIANDMGYMPVIRNSKSSENKYAKKRLSRWDIEFGIATGIENNVGRSWRTELDENNTWRKVKSINLSTTYSGIVYNLEVEKDHSYIAESIGVHNCVGFSMADFGINLPINTFYTNDDAHKFYYKCKIEDGEPNEENGSCIRSAAKVLRKEGKIDGYAFAPDMGTIKWWLLNKSPMIVGTIWTEEMFLPDFKNALNIGGEVVGGHAYLINEWTEDNMIGIQNSWGSGWGINGKAYISASNFEKLFIRDGEALAAVEVEISHKCFLMDLLSSKVF